MNPLFSGIGSAPSGSSGNAISDVVPTCLRDCEDLIHQMRIIGQMFHARGWSVGTSSNYSAICQRAPLQLVITASGRDKGALGTGDFVRVDGHGHPTETGQPKSSAETLIHCLLAERSDVAAILHTHSIWATLLSDFYAEQGGFWIEDYEMLKGLEGITTHQDRVWVDIFDNSQDIPALVAQIRARWSRVGEPSSQANNTKERPSHGFLLRQHGLYTWGHDLFTARRHVEIFEFLFECVARKLMLPKGFAATRILETTL